MKLDQRGGSGRNDAGATPSVGPNASAVPRGDVRDARPSLTALEWGVVAAAFSDASGHACGSARKPSRWAAGLRGLIRALTGLGPPRPLADPRLEKLRYFICFTRDHGQPSQRIWNELLEMGFSEAQVEAFALLALQGVTPRG